MQIPVTPSDGFSYFGARPNPTPRKSELDMEAFLKLLTVQLANQNPLEPMNDRDFFAQLAQLGTVQGLDQLKASMEAIQINDLIGKTVSAIRPMSQTGTGFDDLVIGKVTGVNMRNGERYLLIQEADGGSVEVRAHQIQQILTTQASGDMNPVSLIGKVVTGKVPGDDGELVDVAGRVLSLSLADGQRIFGMMDANGQRFQLNVNAVTGVYDDFEALRGG